MDNSQLENTDDNIKIISSYRTMSLIDKSILPTASVMEPQCLTNIQNITNCVNGQFDVPSGYSNYATFATVNCRELYINTPKYFHSLYLNNFKGESS